MMSNSCTPMGKLEPLSPQKIGAGANFLTSLIRVGAWSKLFLAIGPEKEYPKLVLKFGGSPNKFAGGGSKLVPNFVIFRLSPISPQRSKMSPFTNLKTDYQTTDTSLRYGEKMVYFAPP